MINIQPIQKIDLQADHSLQIHGIFPTIQGEGPLTGHPATFIRFAGCNLRCPGCDTVYTGPTVRKMSPEAILAEVRKLHPGPRLVVITGGEPFRQSLGLLTQLLEDEGYQIQIETNGTLPVPAGIAASTWIVVSPKTGRVHQSVADVAVAWKYVLSEDSVSEDDGLPLLALHHTAAPRVARPPTGFPIGAIYVQPFDCGDEWGNGGNLKACIASCLKHGYTLQLQLHKILGIE